MKRLEDKLDHKSGARHRCVERDEQKDHHPLAVILPVNVGRAHMRHRG